MDAENPSSTGTITIVATSGITIASAIVVVVVVVGGGLGDKCSFTSTLESQGVDLLLHFFSVNTVLYARWRQRLGVLFSLCD